MRRARIDHALVRQLAADGMKPEDIAVRPDVRAHASYVRTIIGKEPGKDGLSRFASKSVVDQSTIALPASNNPAFYEKRTLYPRTRVDPATNPHDLFKSGFHAAKIGKCITKGRWKGFHVYTLTLEERATCPVSCQHWRSCYGNVMQHAQRAAHGEALETAIVYELQRLARRHPDGFAIRLHVLGDFYSVRYVKLWEILLDECPPLHVFGFSARWDCQNDPIAKALVDLVLRRWDRFAIRFSNAPVDECSTVSIEHPLQKPADAFICPQQTGRTAACATCGACWNTKKRVAFIQH